MCICSIELDWLCLGNPTAHHDVMPCAPEKIPEFLLQVFVYTFKMKYSIAFGLISQSSSSSSSFDEKNGKSVHHSSIASSTSGMGFLLHP